MRLSHEILTLRTKHPFVIAALQTYAPVLADADPFAIEDIEAALVLALHGNPSTRAAISTALHDLAGKRLGISAAAQFAPLLDDADLDGGALLANDPFAGVTIDGGVVRLSDKPGLGVTRHPK